MNFTAEAQVEIDKLYHGRKHVELTIGILKDGNTELVHFGPDKKEDSKTTLVYPVGSICKLFVGTLFAKLIEERKAELDAPLDRYIPGLPERYYPSLKKLATHTSGFTTQPYNVITTLPYLLKMNREGGLFHTNPFRGKLNEDGLLKILRETKIKEKEYPFVYSNIGMSILGYIEGLIEGDGFWDTMTRYIREELGLTQTFLGNVNMKGYDRKDQPCGCWRWEKEDVIAPAGALNATMEDLLKFAKIHLEVILSYTSLCHQVYGPMDKTTDSGLAWRLEKAEPISWHDGNAGAFSAYLGLNRETKTAVAVGTNYGLVNAKEIGFAILRNI